MLRRTVVCLAVISCSVLLWAGASGAQGAEPPYPEQPPSSVTPTTASVLPDRVTRQPTVQGQRVQRGSSLPITGGDLLGLAAIGGATLAVGGGLVLQGRRTR